MGIQLNKLKFAHELLDQLGDSLTFSGAFGATSRMLIPGIASFFSTAATCPAGG
jgi:hypothetical protein